MNVLKNKNMVLNRKPGSFLVQVQQLGVANQPAYVNIKLNLKNK